MWLISLLLIIPSIHAKDIQFVSNGKLLEVEHNGQKTTLIPVWNDSHKLVNVVTKDNKAISKDLKDKVLKWYQERKVNHEKTPNSFYQCH